jgi:hypothetical protein
MDFNINERVRVKLTDHGRKIHREDHEAFWSQQPEHVQARFPYKPPKEDAEGWSEWQMHNLMELFGSHVGVAKELPFETTIQLVEPKPWPVVAAPDPMDAVREMCR